MSDISTVTVTRSWDGWSVWRDADGDHIGTVRTHKTDEDCNDCDDETIVYALVPVDAMEEVWWCVTHGISALSDRSGRVQYHAGWTEEQAQCEVVERQLVVAKEEE